jgi:hypothetical protein
MRSTVREISNASEIKEASIAAVRDAPVTTSQSVRFALLLHIGTALALLRILSESIG